ncbi:gliding motility-associated protein GldE [Bacteroidota bacterium]
MDDPYPCGFIFILLSTDNISFYISSGLAIIILLLLSAMVSGSEVAFFSLTAGDIKHFQHSDSRHERTAFKLIQKPKELLATILILNNTINVALVTLTTFMAWGIFGTNTLTGKVVIGLTLVVTFAIVFFGEVLPKVYANQNNLKFVRMTSVMIDVSRSFLKPFTWFLNSFSNIIEKRIEKRGYTVSVEELNKALELTTKSETTEEERGILKGIFNFGMLSVKQVMKSRVDITAIDIETGFHELMDKINKGGYSRIPIYRESIDKIEGILYIKDLLPYIDQNEKFKWQELLRPGYFVPETKKIDALFRDFQDKRVHMAIVVDEYGGTSGLITMEDVIEEIVGEINDEFDEQEEIAYHKLDDNTYIFEGKTSLNDFSKITSSDPLIFEDVKGESESLGGLLLELHSKIPRVGEKIEFNNFVFTTIAVDNRRIKRIRVLIKSVIKPDQSD